MAGGHNQSHGATRWMSDPLECPTELPSMQIARSSRLARRLARFLATLLVLTFIALIFVPWQQSVRGKGQVTAYAPLLRQQTVQAPTSGRIVEWNPKIVEGARVTQGELILEIRDLDPELQNRLIEQRDATLRKIEAAKTKRDVYLKQAEAFREARELAVSAADELVKAAQQKVRAEQQNLEAAQAAEAQEKLNFEQLEKATKAGVAAGLEFQVADRKFKEAKAKVEQARAYIESARNELASKEAERGQKEREAQAKVEAAHAYAKDAEGEVAIAEKDLADIQVKVSRQENQAVCAPQDGFVLRVMVNPGSDIVKAGDPLFVLVPETTDRAVELLVDGNDAPLITPGRHVRLQFEGWPSVQFAGWPSVAVGTFGGRVVTVDSTDNGQGQFRILVQPDGDEVWPADQYLRQGVRANGWVLLNQVTLGYELWRQMNGFPPVVAMKEPKEKAGSPLKKSK